MLFLFVWNTPSYLPFERIGYKGYIGYILCLQHFDPGYTLEYIRLQPPASRGPLPTTRMVGRGYKSYRGYNLGVTKCRPRAPAQIGISPINRDFNLDQEIPVRTVMQDLCQRTA